MYSVLFKKVRYLKYINDKNCKTISFFKKNVLELLLILTKIIMIFEIKTFIFKIIILKTRNRERTYIL